MESKTPAKVIQLHPPKQRRVGDAARVIAITSGKGGVGKTNIVANLGLALSRRGKRVLVLDADLGLGNLDVLLGIAPRYNLSHVLNGEREIDEVLVEGPGGLLILPAASGLQDLTRLEGAKRRRLVAALERLLGEVDVMLIDTAAGISSDVMYFNISAHDILVVVSPEPTSITDAYALMKVLSLRYSERRFNLLVNMARDEEEAGDVFRQLKLVADRFLAIELDFVGHVPNDAHVPRSVMRQKLVSDIFPECPAAQCFDKLGRYFGHRPAARRRDKGFWNRLGADASESFENL
jgi:flagellar biosynthesis protein FlhG